MEQYSEELFDKARDRIYHQLMDKNIDEVEGIVLGIVEELDGRGPTEKQFSEWGIEELLSAQGRLSLLRVNLGIAAARARAKANHIVRWHIFQSSKQWNPVKTRVERELEKAGKKLLKNDIDSVIIEGLWQTTEMEVFKQEIADRLEAVFDSTNQVLTAIKMQITQKTSEAQQAKYFQNTGEDNGK